MANKTMPPERKQRLRQLAALMNTRHRSPFPITPPLLDCFDVAVTNEETELLLRLGPNAHSYAEAASLSGMPEDRFGMVFDALLRKGFIWTRLDGGGEKFFLAGIMLGWFEIYLASGDETAEKREFARRLDALFKSWGKMNIFALRGLLNSRARRSRPQQSILPPAKTGEPIEGRKIVVNQVVNADPVKIYPAQTVRELLEQHGEQGRIAVIQCFCRRYHKMIDEACRFQHPPHSCLTIGKLARHAVDYGTGRSISKEEARALLDELEGKGAVHQVFHECEDPDEPAIAICSCCWDCCGVFGSYNRGIVPLHLKSYFEARIKDSSLCNGCLTCVDHCPVSAIGIVSGKARIDRQKCIGCGQCELQCPEEAVSLIPNKRNVMLPLLKRSEARIPL